MKHFIYNLHVRIVVFSVHTANNLMRNVFLGVKTSRAVGCVLTAPSALIVCVWLLMACSSIMTNTSTRPVPRHPLKSFQWYDSSHLDCILCQQEPRAGSTTHRRTAAVSAVLAQPLVRQSHGEQLRVQGGQWRGGGISPSQAAQASG